MKGKTILIVSQYTKQPEYTGDMRNYDWGRHLITLGNTVYILCASLVHGTTIDLIEGDEEYKIVDDSSGIKYVYVKTPMYQDNGMSRIKNMGAFYFIALKIMKKLPVPDLIIAKSPNPMACVAALKYAKKKKIPCVCDIVDLWPESIAVYQGVSRSNPLMKLLYQGEKWIYKTCSALIFSDEGDYDYVIEKGWEKAVPKEKAFYVNIGINIEDNDRNKEEYKLDDPALEEENTFKVIYSGSVRTVNNLKLLVDAGKIIQDKGYSDIRVLIYGGGDQVDELRQYCKDQSITNVQLYGRMEKKYVPYILSKADVCAFCYQSTPLLRFGGSMNKMFDFLASGKPIIANAKMGYSLIEGRGAGKELDSNDAEDYAAEIIKFHDMPKSERDKYGTAGRKVAEEYDIHNLCNQMMVALEYAEEHCNY